MRPTRRGFVVFAVALLAIGHGAVFGQRALNFVAAPALAALAVGAIQCWRARPPSVDRSTLRPGFPGDTRSETVEVDGSGVATLRESLPDGLEGEAVDRTVSLPHTFDRDLTLRERGVYELGPLSVAQRDALGLFVRPADGGPAGEAVVYPELYALDRSGVLGALLGEERHTAGQSFDRLREYEPGDPLRRIHWKSTAKHDDLLVVEYDPAQRTDPIHVVVDGPVSLADELAAAAASLTFVALDAGLEVSLTLPDEQVSDGRGANHRENVLRVLARTGDGAAWGDRAESQHLSAAVHDAADVLIRGRGGTVTVDVGGTRRTLEELRDAGTNQPPDPTASAPRDPEPRSLMDL